ncbi:MAG: hypothetical protein AAF198_07210 [Pseudomonadota bacterium]
MRFLFGIGLALCSAGASIAQSNDGFQREPFGRYIGAHADVFGDGGSSNAGSDVRSLGIYYGINFQNGHVEFHVDAATFELGSNDDEAYRIQVSYSPEFVGPSEIAFYAARNFFGNYSTDVTEYGLSSNTILDQTESWELYLSAAAFDLDGTIEPGLTAGIGYAPDSSNFAAELSFATYSFDSAAGVDLEYNFSDSGFILSGGGLVNQDGDAVARIGFEYRFGVDRQKFRPAITPYDVQLHFRGE